MEAPRVSVIIPNFNHARFLNQRIDSVLRQTFQDFEVILLDDCSTDQSREVLESYRNHAKITIIDYNEKNSGSPFMQWKKGMRLARGKYIWIAESDDYCDDGLLAELMDLVDQDDQLDLVYCNSVVVDDTGMKIKPDMNWWTNDLSDTKWNSNYIEEGKSELKDYLVYKCIIPNASAVLFKKDNGLNLIDQSLSYKFCGDWLFWSNYCFESRRIAYVKKTHNFFRSTSSSTRQTFNPQRALDRLIEIYQILHSNCKLLNESPQAYLDYFFCHHFPYKNRFLFSHINRRVLKLIFLDPRLPFRLIKHLLKS